MVSAIFFYCNLARNFLFIVYTSKLTHKKFRVHYFFVWLLHCNRGVNTKIEIGLPRDGVGTCSTENGTTPRPSFWGEKPSISCQHQKVTYVSHLPKINQGFMSSNSLFNFTNRYFSKFNILSI